MKTFETTFSSEESWSDQDSLSDYDTPSSLTESSEEIEVVTSTYDEEQLLTYINKDIDKIKRKAWVIEEWESTINMDEPLYLITWCPDPKETPDVDFNTQHRFHIDTVVRFLLGCETGLFCVEATQKGEPHYHGWYQMSSEPLVEEFRLAAVKVMQRYGLVKIDEAFDYRIHSWTCRLNALHYYKKDMLDRSLLWEPNPITKYTEITKTDHDDIASMFVGIGERKTVQKVLEMRKMHESAFEYYLHKK